MNRRDLLAAGVVGASMPMRAIHAQTNRYAPFKGTTLNICVPAHPHYDAMVKLLPMFTAETGIKVEVDRQEIPKMKELQLVDLAKPQSSYDLISYVVMWKGEYVKKKLIQPLEPFLKNAALADPDYDMADIVPAYLENLGLVGGWRGYLAGPEAKLYGLPYGAETSILAYRRDVFDKLNLRPPSTYFEFEYLLPLLREKTGMGALSSRGKTGHQCVHAWLLHLNPMSGKVFDVQWRPRFNDLTGVRALKLLDKVIKTGPQGAIEFGYSEAANAFLQGETAMFLDSTVIFGSVRNSPKSKIAGKVGYARHPKASIHASQSGGLGLAIPKTTSKAPAAFLLMQWLTSKEQDKAVCLAGGGPMRMSTLLDEKLVAEFPEYVTMRLQLRDVEPDWRPIIPEWDDININALGVGIGETLHGKKSAEEGLNDAVPKVLAIMQKAGYLRG